MKTIEKTILILFIAISAASCVTQEKYNEAKESEARYYDEARRCGESLASANVKNKELEAELTRLKALKAKADADTAKLSKELRRVQDDCNNMQEQNRALLEKLQTSKSKEEAQAMLAEIQALQSELIKREDALFQAERQLSDKQKELELRNAKISELTDLIADKERKMQEIKEKIKKALTSYEGDGLQITTKNGRIYVSLDEQLLFQSGKWDVDARGAAAISKLSTVLAQHKDINVMVEGHTDNVPYNGSGNILDNWDLSVKRATAIVRILLKSGDLEPERVIASGRSEYNPVDTDNTSDARKRNRRTEIILSPNLDELMKIFE
ncbi:MAG: OmpA family protein [Paludibacteraceae bacterium]|jgi:chemotaxis protein MotB|nr:OmpA family protein [Paludibacteraceae bacterium]OQA46712.1 MAG: putative lipoprotein YiaD precursor [Bacteroidetes bacterium ADurb.Bin302]HOH96050.1 OmpA family protein [Candidatus Enterocola sp.]HPG55668.1 OmpA family protein [Candidatus Enterocola sp.]